MRESTMPLGVDFYADWCGPRWMMAPAFAEFARRQAGRALLIELDPNRNLTMAIRNAIGAIPIITIA